jgi:predicted metal-binding membrane protein
VATLVASRRNWLLPIISGLIAAAWAALLLWEQSPYGRYLDHGGWTQIGLAGTVCHAVPGASLALPLGLYAGGWVLMIAAMMLPTAFPVLQRFVLLTSEREDGVTLVILLVAGYLAVWFGFGMGAHALDFGLHAMAHRSGWFLSNAWIVGAAILATAGLFQFSHLKYHCLDACRTPVSFIVRHWRGISPRGSAFRLGVHHGAYCVGCCWAIMLLMFLVGTGNVGWMLMLGAVMGVEKNAAWGRRLSRPLGVVLAGWAVLIVGAHVG